MDLKRLKRGELLALVGGIVLFIGMFLDWYSVGGGGGTVKGPFGEIQVPGFEASATGWDESFIWVLLLVVVAVLAVGLGVLTAASRTVALPVAASALTAGGGIVGVVVVVINMLTGHKGLDLDIGIFVALAGTIVIALGGWMSMQEEGTSFREAGQQAQQAAGQFTQPGQQPPPPGAQPPPPPPPPPAQPPPPPPPPESPGGDPPAA